VSDPPLLDLGEHHLVVETGEVEELAVERTVVVVAGVLAGDESARLVEQPRRWA